MAVIGLDIGYEDVRGVLYEPGQGRAVRSDAVPFAPGELPAALRRLAASLRAGSARVAVTAQMEVLSARLRLPFRDPKRIAEVVPFQAEDEFPCDVRDWAVGHCIVQELAEGAEVLAFAVPRERLDELMDALLEAGLYPQLIVPRALALLHAAALRRPEGGGAIAAVWVEAGRASLAVESRDGVPYVRSFPLAAGDREAAAALCRELRTTMWEAGVAPGQCLLCAGGQLADSALGALPEAWPGPVESLASAEADEAELALAIGAAGAAGSEPALDLAAPLRSPALIARAARVPLTALLLLVLMAGLLYGARAAWGGLAARRAARRSHESLHAGWQALYPSEPLPTDPLLRIEADLRALAAGSEVEDAPVPVEPLAVLQRVLEALPRQGNLKVDGFRLTAGELTLTCSARSLAAADQAVAALQEALEWDVLARRPESLDTGEHSFEIFLSWDVADDTGT
jgi:hypothetical protein